MRRDSAEGLRPSSAAAARAEPRRTVRMNASSARKGGRRRIGTRGSVQYFATAVEWEAAIIRRPDASAAPAGAAAGG